MMMSIDDYLYDRMVWMKVKKKNHYKCYKSEILTKKTNILNRDNKS